MHKERIQGQLNWWEKSSWRNPGLEIYNGEGIGSHETERALHAREGTCRRGVCDQVLRWSRVCQSWEQRDVRRENEERRPPRKRWEPVEDGVLEAKERGCFLGKRNRASKKMGVWTIGFSIVGLLVTLTRAWLDWVQERTKLGREDLEKSNTVNFWEMFCYKGQRSIGN